MPNELPAFQTGNNQSNAETASRAVWQFRVESIINDAPSGKYLVHARTWNGTDKGETDYIVETTGARSVGNSFLASKVERGEATKYPTGADAKPIVWLEVGGGVTVSFCKAKTDWQPSFSAGANKTITVDPCDIDGTVPPGSAAFDVYLSGNINRGPWYAAIKQGDVLAYLSIPEHSENIKGILFSLPITGGDIFSLMQTTGMSATGFDYLRTFDPPV